MGNLYSGSFIMINYRRVAEAAVMKRLITKVYPTGMVSIVSDTFDLWEVLTKILPALKDEIMARDGKVVIRPDCYDDQTKVMTSLGWKFFKDLENTDLVAQVLGSGEFEYVAPLKYTSSFYKGIMVHFTDKKGKLDLLVTPNHRMIFKTNGVEKIQTAEDALVGKWKKDIVRSSSAKSYGKKFTALDALKVAFQADGSFCTNMTSSIRFSFSKQRKIDRLEKLLKQLDLTYKIYSLKDGKSEFNIKVEANDFTKDFSWVSLKTLEGDWCRGFIEELSYWDATRRSDTRFKFDTTNPMVIKIVELIALASGYGVLISEAEDNRKECFSNVFTAHILKSNKIGGQSHNKEEVQYEGMVYCVTVPSGRLLVKRNRATAVCGNSGDPVDIICGLTGNKNSTPQDKGVIEILWDIFGGTINEAGFKVLDSHIGAIYGDAITLDRAEEICQRLANKGFASTNIVLGIGSYTYQYNTRDTFGFAMKSTFARVDGEDHMLFKDPVTDDGTKKSQFGKVVVEEVNGVLYYQDGYTDTSEMYSLLQPIFIDGVLLNETTLSEIRSLLHD